MERGSWSWSAKEGKASLLFTSHFLFSLSRAQVSFSNSFNFKCYFREFLSPTSFSQMTLMFPLPFHPPFSTVGLFPFRIEFISLPHIIRNAELKSFKHLRIRFCKILFRFVRICKKRLDQYHTTFENPHAHFQ